MFKLRDVIIFLAGAEFFHTLSHIVIAYFIPLPLDIHYMLLTPTLNAWAIGVNAIITLALLWYAKKLSY